MNESATQNERMILMSEMKWNELRDYVIQGLVQAEAGDKYESERVLRITLEKMDELDKKYHKPTNA